MTATRNFWNFALRTPRYVWGLCAAGILTLPFLWHVLGLPEHLGSPQWQWVSLPWVAALLLMLILSTSYALVQAQPQRTAHAIYSAAYRTLPDAAGITSLKDGRFIDVNPALCSLLGQSYDSIVGRTNAELGVYATPFERTKLLDELSVNGQVDRMRILCQSHGVLVPGTISAAYIDVHGEPCMLFVFHDMREHDKAVHDLHGFNRLLQQAGHLAKLGAWEDRRGAGLVYWSDACYDMHGVPRSHPLPRDYLQTFVAPEHRERMRAQLQHCLRAKKDWELEVQIVRTDGRKLWVRLRGEAVTDDDGKIVSMRGVMQDIDERKQQEALIRQREALLSVTLDAAALGRWDWDLLAGTITGDASWRNFNGLHSTETPASLGPAQNHWHWTELMRGQDVARCNAELTRHIAAPDDGPFDMTWHLQPSSGPSRWLRSIGKVVSYSDTGKAQRMLGVCLDVTAQQEQKHNLQQLAHFDALTGLANRVELGARLQESLRLCRQSVQLMAVVYLDLDGFKPVNDKFGHQVGDQLLVMVAKRLQHAMRAHDCVARFGGDEFVLIINQLNSRAECEASLQRLMASISRPYSLNGEFANVSASIGYTLYPEDDGDADTLIRHADQAMYQAKQAGRHRIEAFDATQDRSQREKHVKSMRIQEGLSKGEFTLYLQPKIDMRNKKLVGVEALARWQHPERGLITPGDFLPHIEGTHLDIPFGQWAIGQAMRTIGQLMELGLRVPLAVNISPKHLQQPGFVAWMQALLAQHPHIPPILLSLEITESAALYDIEHVAQVLRELRDLHLGISLDDFGTGYSSLAYLRKLPVDSLKVDRSFVQNMLTDAADYAIVHGIVSLAHSFGYHVIAEGVEDDAQCICLQHMGCHEVQGYYFARPMPAHQLPFWAQDFSNTHASASRMAALP
jgi:diguanylate cyclase (GGDEF)-like protein/PAS domain S-box-containing protein